jgi:hypothetical protein
MDGKRKYGTTAPSTHAERMGLCYIWRYIWVVALGFEKHLLSFLGLFCFVSICSVRMAGGIAQPLFFLQLVSLLLLYPPQPVPPAPFLLVYAVYPPFFVMLVLPSCYHFIESELRMFWIDTTCYVQLPFSTFYRYITL